MWIPARHESLLHAGTRVPFWLSRGCGFRFLIRRKHSWVCSSSRRNKCTRPSKFLNRCFPIATANTKAKNDVIMGYEVIYFLCPTTSVPERKRLTVSCIIAQSPWQALKWFTNRKFCHFASGGESFSRWPLRVDSTPNNPRSGLWALELKLLTTILRPLYSI